MPRRRDEYEVDEDEEEEYDAVDEEEDSEDDGRKTTRKRGGRSNFVDDSADEEDDDDDDDEYRGGGGGSRGGKRRRKVSFFDDEAIVDSDGEEDDEEDGEDDFIDPGDDIPHEDDRQVHRRPLLPREDEHDEDVEEIERRIQERYADRSLNAEYDDEATDVEQQALLPSIRDPTLWMVKCAIGREREVAVCLMQKCIDKGPEMQIRSVVALDHLKNYIYVEANKEAHVKEAVKGMRNIYTTRKFMNVPIKEMTDVLSVESKVVDISRDTWVRIKIGIYKGDLAKVVDVDNVRQRATVKLIPRIDLQALANKLEGREVPKKKAFTPPARYMNIDEARELHIRVESKRDPSTGDYYEKIEGMMFKDGFLYKNVSLKSVRVQNVQPTFDELEKFRHPSESGDRDMSSLAMLFANRKKGHFMKGDQVIVIKGDLRNLKGRVEKVEEDIVHIKPDEKLLLKTLAISGKDLCKYFKSGNHVKVVSGSTEGATGVVATVEGHVVNIVSDATHELLRVFVDNVVKSSEVTSGVARIGDYELHDLVQLNDNSFGIIIRVESEAVQVLKGVPERPDVALVKLREIKYKIEKKGVAKDRYNNPLSVKDVVKILDGSCRGKHGPIEHLYRGVLFIYDQHHLEHAGFICVKAGSCMMVGGSRANGDSNGNSMSSRFNHLRTPLRVHQSPMRPPRGDSMNDGVRRRSGRGGHDALVGTAVNICKGSFKGCKGRVIDVKGSTVRVELESQMKIVAVDRNSISDKTNASTSFRETSRYGMGSETPMHPSRTPMHPFMTPMRDTYATPHHDGMRTPMRDRAWNPYAPMSPPRDNWEDANPVSWETSPQYIDAGTPRDIGSGYANAPSPYLPSTPGGLDMMSPVVGGDNDSPRFLPDILVSVRKSGKDTSTGVIKEMLQGGSCKIALGSSGNGETITALPSEIEVLRPRKTDMIKIMGGAHRGSTGRLMGIDGTDGIVKVDNMSDAKILDMAMLAKAGANSMKIICEINVGFLMYSSCQYC